MKTHELYKNIASILTQKNSEELFDYIVHSMDYHGSFLRSRYCYWENVIPDIDCGEIATVLLSLNQPFDFNESANYYEDIDSPYPFTILKMQLFLYDLSNSERFRQKSEWSAAAGFAYPLKVSLPGGSFEILPAVNNLRRNNPIKRRNKRLTDFLQSNNEE